MSDDSRQNDDYDPDSPDSYQDIDQMMEDTLGKVPEAGKAYTIADDEDGEEEEEVV